MFFRCIFEEWRYVLLFDFVRLHFLLIRQFYEQWFHYLDYYFILALRSIYFFHLDFNLETVENVLRIPSTYHPISSWYEVSMANSQRRFLQYFHSKLSCYSRVLFYCPEINFAKNDCERLYAFLSRVISHFHLRFKRFVSRLVNNKLYLSVESKWHCFSTDPFSLNIHPTTIAFLMYPWQVLNCFHSRRKNWTGFYCMWWEIIFSYCKVHHLPSTLSNTSTIFPQIWNQRLFLWDLHCQICEFRYL